MGRGKKSKGKAQQAGKKKGKSRSGNPAKRALEAQQGSGAVGGVGPGTTSGDLGVPAGLDLPADFNVPDDFELPEELKGMLPPNQR